MFQTTDQQCMLCCLIKSIKHILYQMNIVEFSYSMNVFLCTKLAQPTSSNAFGKIPQKGRTLKRALQKNQPMESDGYGHLVFDSKSLVINQLFLRGIQLISVVVVQNSHGRWSCHKVVNDLLACHGKFVESLESM